MAIGVEPDVSEGPLLARCKPEASPKIQSWVSATRLRFVIFCGECPTADGSVIRQNGTITWSKSSERYSTWGDVTAFPIGGESVFDVSQKVLQFQSRGTLLLTVDLAASGLEEPPLPLPIIGVTGIVVAAEFVLLLRERLAASQLQYWFQQCLQARDSAPSGWNSAS